MSLVHLDNRDSDNRGCTVTTHLHTHTHTCSLIHPPMHPNTHTHTHTHACTVTGLKHNVADYNEQGAPTVQDSQL